MRPRDAACLLALAVLAARCKPPPPPAQPTEPPPAAPPPAAQPPPVAPPPVASSLPADPPPASPAPTASASAAPGRSPSASLDPDVIQRIVRQNFGRFRACYEEYLSHICCPNLQGRVTVRFVIGRDGGVTSARAGGSDLPDSNAIACVVRAVYGLSFPPPKGGPLTVTYPFLFSPGG